MACAGEADPLVVVVGVNSQTRGHRLQLLLRVFCDLLVTDQKLEDSVDADLCPVHVICATVFD